MSTHTNTFPKLHNAAWPGVVGKEPGTDNPPIDLDTMLDYTANAEHEGVKFDGTDLFLFDPHVNIEFDKSSANYERSRDREIRVVFDPGFKVGLISSTSGLSQTNPPLGAQIVDNVLTYTTRNAVTDTFSIKIEKQPTTN